jgi:hypothetical protein
VSKVEEFFVDSPVFPENYIVSNYGTIITKKTGKIRKNCFDKDGYYYVRLFNKGKVKYMLVHRLVALAFIPNDNENNNIVNHKDGNKINNYIENLEWCDVRYNTIHSYSLGLQISLKGEKHGRSKYKEKDIIKVCDFLQNTYLSYEEIEKLTGIPIRTIASIKSGENWTSISKNYIFKNRRLKKTCND